MNEGKDRAEWWHTASVEAMIANSVRNPKKRRRAWTPDLFHPWETQDKKRRRKSEDGKVDISILKAVFVEGATVQEIEDEYGV